jgi:acetyl-CoA carboxylase carboxyl transferase subunit beta
VRTKPGRGRAHIAVAGPTTGGIWAALGAGADVIIGIRQATVAFAGMRVRGDQQDTDGFRAEGKYRAGQIDLVTAWADLPGILADLVELLAAARTGAARLRRPGAPRARPPISPGRVVAAPPHSATRRAARHRLPRRLLKYGADQRRPGRRRGPGDAVRCHRHDGRTAAYAPGRHQHPGRIPTATRLIQPADRLGIPVLTIDTPGARTTRPPNGRNRPGHAGLFPRSPRRTCR